MELLSSCKCDRRFRENAAWLDVQKGIKVHNAREFIDMKCRNRSCPCVGKFIRHVRSAMWVLSRMVPHDEECVGPFSGRAKTDTDTLSTSPYEEKKTARLLTTDVHENPSIPATKIVAIIRAKEIYTRKPPMRFYRSVRKVLMDNMGVNRTIEMATMPGFLGIFGDLGRKVSLFSMGGKEMREPGLKAARFFGPKSESQGDRQIGAF